MLIALAGTLVFSLILMVEYPDRLIQPGRLSDGHRNLESDCLRCHTPMKGATGESCRSCHKLADIGLRTVGGAPRTSAIASKAGFHQGLAETDCTGCHMLHASERHRRTIGFKHDFLAPSVRNECQSCHGDRKPANALHRSLKTGCASCHVVDGWRAVTFNHSRITAGLTCITCHQKDKPGDDLHRGVQDGCGQCHSTERWRPASFDHARWFRFDANHPSDCRTCHADAGNFKTYSCYGCHAHTPANIAGEHREEGIRNLDNCARCHRSGSEGEKEREGSHHENGEREEKEEED